MLRFTFIAGLLTLLAGCNDVTVTPAPATVPGGGSSVITATVTNKVNGVATPIPPNTVNFTVDQAGTVGATATTGAGTGVATQTFTAAYVSQNTVATIKAKCGSGKGTCTVIVTPVAISAPFVDGTGVPVPLESVSVLVTSAPSPKGLKYTMVVTPSNGSRVIRFITLTFLPPVKAVSSSVGTTSGQPASPSQIWNYTNGSAVPGAITLTIDDDYSVGGTIAWDVVGQDTATTVWHANISTPGPQK